MTKKEMAARIADLETIIELQNRVLRDSGYYYQPRLYSPGTTTDLKICDHEYPSPWFGTVPPQCKKCGQQAPAYTVTCTGNSTSIILDSPGNFNTSGYAAKF